MPHLLTPQGEAALAELLRRGPLLAFDFDGTLAPIAPKPEMARISRTVSSRLERITSLLPVAVLTGRSTEDVRTRLSFEPHFIVGNHGAESALARDRPLLAARLEGLRGQLSRWHGELAQLGITVEDKELSIALHYRLAANPERARNAIVELVREHGHGLHAFPGKMVENIVPAGSPDKGQALHALVARCGAPCAMFIGDDANDEPAFESALDGWLTVRVGRDDPTSRAAYFLDGQAEVALLLDLVLRLLREHGRPSAGPQ